MEEKIKQIEIEQIKVSPFQPRKHFSEEEINELASSIKSVGLIHPPVVREVGSGKKVLYYELIAGERRWRAAQRAGLSSISVIIRPYSDDEAAKSTLIENVQRVDLDPIEMALAFKKLMETFRMTQEEVAEKVGKKRSTVANYLRLLTLPESTRKAVSTGEISMGHAKAILSLDSEAMQQKLHDMIVETKLSVRESEKRGRQIGKKPRKEAHVEDLEEKLKERLKRNVDVHYSAKSGGKIVLHYYDVDDLDRLLTSLFSEENALELNG